VWERGIALPRGAEAEQGEKIGELHESLGLEVLVFRERTPNRDMEPHAPEEGRELVGIVERGGLELALRDAGDRLLHPDPALVEADEGGAARLGAVSATTGPVARDGGWSPRPRRGVRASGVAGRHRFAGNVLVPIAQALAHTLCIRRARLLVGSGSAG
jgi:hypothetical protein